MNENWFRRRWFDFRTGHSVYLIFILSFGNFVLIFHRLLIERVELLSEIFPSLWMFLLVFISLYIPIAIIIGHWHRNTQLQVETQMNVIHNPLMARNFRMLVDILEGKASKEEIIEFRKFLLDIEKGRGTYQDDLNH